MQNLPLIAAAIILLLLLLVVAGRWIQAAVSTPRTLVILGLEATGKTRLFYLLQNQDAETISSMAANTALARLDGSEYIIVDLPRHINSSAFTSNCTHAVVMVDSTKSGVKELVDVVMQVINRDVPVLFVCTNQHSILAFRVPKIEQLIQAEVKLRSKLDAAEYAMDKFSYIGCGEINDVPPKLAKWLAMSIS